MGDGNTIYTTTDTVYYTYTDPGVYYVTLTMLNQEGCERSILQEVTVDALPEPAFSFNPALCDETTFFTDLTDPGAGSIRVKFFNPDIERRSGMKAAA